MAGAPTRLAAPMSMPMLLTLLPCAVFCGLLAAAAMIDVRSDRIPNLLPALLALGALLVLPHGAAEWLSRTASFGIVAVTLLILYALRGMGGGDVKLLAATALWMPFASLPVFVLALAVAGGLQAAGTLAYRKLRGVALAERKARSMPYALSIAAAGYAWAWIRWSGG